jgi:hypothetical protein
MSSVYSTFSIKYFLPTLVTNGFPFFLLRMTVDFGFDLVLGILFPC